ncbi:protein usf-like [Ylistrum balloti]|uniref:protein usf-like n=1 Tax=Ylistrum balloti TaxID=509963 RepID=UPI002905A383|nr:protein usf-like [Ylistrum balloti]
MDSFESGNKLGKCPYKISGDVSKTKKGLIVLQEWWGLNDQIKNVAVSIGNMGNFVTLVPDLYRGKKTTDNEEAGHFMGNLDWEGAVLDIQGAAKKLKSMGCTKVGVTGFCMGGALSLASAVRVSEIDAAASFYGIPGDGLADVSKIRIPLQCHFGTKDAVEGFSCPKSQAKLREKLDNGKVAYDFFSYDAGHAFTNETSPNYYKDCSDLALGRLVDFMNKNL